MLEPSGLDLNNLLKESCNSDKEIEGCEKHVSLFSLPTLSSAEILSFKLEFSFSNYTQTKVKVTNK